MTLLDDAAITRLNPVHHPELPQPTTARWHPLRIGLIDLWQYDDARFRFDETGLLLHGRNQSGKTKVMEVAIPLLLQGDLNPRALDPFDTKEKRMRWNVLDWRPPSDARKSAISYVFLELGRLDADGAARFFTSGVGCRATASAESHWLWTIEDQRVDLDLDLAPDSTPLTTDRLRAVEGLRFHGEGKVGRAGFQAAIRAALYPGMTEVRFASMLSVIAGLRRPQLAAKVNIRELHAALTEALPPPDPERVVPLVDHFQRLDELRAEQSRLAGQSRILDRFVDVYREWARRVAYDAARGFTAANSAFDRVTRIERDSRADLTTAEAALASIAAEMSEADERLLVVTSSLDALDRSAMKQLAAAAAEARGTEQAAQAKGDTLRAVASLAESRAEQAATASRQAREAIAAVEDSLRRATEVGAAAGIRPGGAAPVSRLEAKALADDVAVQAAQARGRIDAATAAVGAHRRAAGAADTARHEHEMALAQVERSAGEATEATARAAAALDAWEAELAPWAARLRAACPTGAGPVDLEEHLDAAADAIGAGDDPSGTLRSLFDEARTVWATEEDLLARRADDARVEAARLQQEADDLEQQTTGAPPARPGVPAGPRAGTPLWDAVDFAEHLSADTRAALEAALEAAGLLDAVVDEGTLATDDTAFIPADGALDTVTLAAVLVPVPGAPAATGDALASVAYIELAGAEPEPPTPRTWVGSDGRWQNGPIHGRWTKPAAVYIGAAARLAANRQRAAACRAEASALEARAAIDAAAAEVVAGYLAVLREPPPPPKACLGAQNRSTRLAERHGERLAEADGRRASADAARQVAAQAADAADVALVPFGRDHAMPGTDELLRDSHAAVKQVTDEIRRLVTLVDQAERRSGNADADALAASDASARELTARADLHEADRAHLAAATALDTLKRALDATAAQVEAEERALTHEKVALGHRLRLLRTGHDGAVAAKAMAETHLLGVAGNRQRAEDDRATKQLVLERVRATPLWALALGPVDDSGPLTVTVARTLASDVTGRLEAAPRAKDDSALIDGYQRIRNDLPDLDAVMGSGEDHRLVEVALAGGMVDIAAFARHIADLAERAAADLSREESDLIQNRIINDLASHISDRIAQATSDVERLNATLRKRAGRGLDTLRFHWEPHPDLIEDERRAVGLLTRLVAGNDQDDRNRFLVHLIADARSQDSAGAVQDRIQAALDYRRFHRFRVDLIDSSGNHKPFTERTHGAGSGGSKARLIHLALFATIASYYDSVSDQVAPRLVALDEAFEGCDDSLASDIMALATELDLDLLLTTYHRWCTYRTVPALAIYDLWRDPEVPGVTAIAYRWTAGSEAKARVEAWDT